MGAAAAVWLAGGAAATCVEPHAHPSVHEQGRRASAALRSWRCLRQALAITRVIWIVVCRHQGRRSSSAIGDRLGDNDLIVWRRLGCCHLARHNVRQGRPCRRCTTVAQVTWLAVLHGLAALVQPSTTAVWAIGPTAPRSGQLHLASVRLT